MILPNAFVRVEHEAFVHVHPEHEAELRRFNDFRRRYARPSSVAVLLVSLLTLVLGFWYPVGPDIMLLTLGVLLTVFPFTTATTYEVMSVRASIWLIRAVGLGFMVFGAWFVLLELL